MATSKRVNPLFTKVRKWIRRWVVLSESQLDVVTMFAFGSHSFSPSAPASPATFPYLYINGPRGSGKTVLGFDVLGALCRNHIKVGEVTGAALFRMMGDLDKESGMVIPHWPTLAIDEIDATYNGAKNEQLRSVLNLGYKRGATVPRAVGTMAIQFPVFCPKALIGIDNGHLPETVTHRSISIQMHEATDAELDSIEELYAWDLESEEVTELRAEIANWTRENSMVLRDYSPQRPKQLKNRQWEISRSLIQLAHAMGNEKRMTESLIALLSDTVKPPFKVRLYQAIYDLFAETGEDRVTTRQILAKLQSEGLSTNEGGQLKPGRGLRLILKGDGINPVTGSMRLHKGHPGVTYDPDKRTPENPSGAVYIHRGYLLSSFDMAFDKYLSDDEEE